MNNKLKLSKQLVEVIYTPDDLETKEKLCRFYPVHYNRKGTVAQLSARLIPEVLESFRGLTNDSIAAAPDKLQELYWSELNARAMINALLENGPNGNPVVTPTLTLMRHQELGREIAKYRDRFAFFYDTRTGKTPLSLSIMYDDIMANPTHKWLVIAPLILLENAWMADAKAFVPQLTVVNCHGATKAKRLEAMKRQANIYLTNIESFASYKEEFEHMGIHGCIVDESSCMKSNSSKQTKALVDFAQQVQRFYLLSGRPSPNGLWEMYPQLKAIDPYSVPSSYTKFKERYFVNVSYNPQYEKLEPRPDKQEELNDIIAKYAIYVDQADVLTMAGRTFYEVELTMPAELKKQYNKLKRELCIEAEGKQITATGAGAMYNKLRQLVSGFVIDSCAVKENKFYDEHNQEVYLLDDYRFVELQKLLRKIGPNQVIIWCTYRFEFDYIKQMLGEHCVILNGTVSNAEKNKAIELFKSGEVRYLVAHPASAKFGLTLTNAHYAIYFSLTFSYEDWKQSSERIYGRIESQPHLCIYYVFMAKGAIDETIYKEVLTGKHSSNMALLNHLKGPAL